ncbi:MAG: H4MPT-linked C1 transfer pathway protein [Alphaproteobacteria bacterium]|nr:H4MPT-linked C1 transfer pathway protein [Alphaproteobacteria bacterium]
MPRSSPQDVIGWDLGGAHLKAARVGADGRPLKVLQLPCRLWLGLGELDKALDQAMAALGPCPRHAVTMTGELADLFRDRRAGVAGLLGAMTERLRGAALLVYAGKAGFLPPRAALRRVDDVASANFLASAEALAVRVAEALFVDLGSTTADLIPIVGGKPRPRGLTDFARLATAELVYTGVTRTPVMAVARDAPVLGKRRGLMAEYFATMADVHRLAGGLPRGADQLPSADNRPKSQADSARRLARMVGADADAHPRAMWIALARHLAGEQLAQVQDAADRVLSRKAIARAAPVIGAGVGRFVVRRLARALDRPYVDAGTVLASGATLGVREGVARCLPAVAVALLAAERSAFRTASSRPGSSEPSRPARHRAPRKPR